MPVITNVITKITAGGSLLHTLAGLRVDSRLRILTYGSNLMNLESVTTAETHPMGSKR